MRPLFMLNMFKRRLFQLKKFCFKIQSGMKSAGKGPEYFKKGGGSKNLKMLCVWKYSNNIT